jgi:hypothetical protein
MLKYLPYVAEMTPHQQQLLCHQQHQQKSCHKEEKYDFTKDTSSS